MTISQRPSQALAYCATFAALIAACSWISIPTTIPFTMQTFGVFFTLLLLGGKLGTLAVATYLLLGAVGAPVFAGFQGGLASLVGSTGGYLLGFLAVALIFWMATPVTQGKKWREILVLVLGLGVCYGLGTLQFVLIYTANTEPVGVMTALGWCVFPYIIPDLLKLALAQQLAVRIRPHLKLQKSES